MEMDRVLRKLNLVLFIEKFNMEKITPDLVGKLSLNEFEKLGVQNMVQRNRKEESQISVELLSLIFPGLFWSVILIKISRSVKLVKFFVCQRVQFIAGCVGMA